MAERRRQEVWNRINRIGVSLHELADEIQALAAELKTEEGEDFAEFSLDDFTRDFASALQNMSTDETDAWGSSTPVADEEEEEEIIPIAAANETWEPVGEGLAFSQADLSAALAGVNEEVKEVVVNDPQAAPVAEMVAEVAVPAPAEVAVVAEAPKVEELAQAEPSVYIPAPENETQSIDDILAKLKISSTDSPETTVAAENIAETLEPVVAQAEAPVITEEAVIETPEPVVAQAEAPVMALEALTETPEPVVAQAEAPVMAETVFESREPVVAQAEAPVMTEEAAIETPEPVVAQAEVPVMAEILPEEVLSELDEALGAVTAEVEESWTAVSADAPIVAQDELAAALSSLELASTGEPAATDESVISLEDVFAEAANEVVEDPKEIEEELAFEPTPPKPAAPAPSDGGMILSEDEIAALLAEAQARAEDVDEEPIFNENGEMNETARFMTELRGESQPEAAPAAAASSAPSSTSGINPHAVQKVPASLALSALAMPVDIEGDQIVLHAAVPLDQIGIAMIGQATGLKPKIIEKPLPEVLDQLRQNYQDPHAPVEVAPRLTNIS